MRTAVLFLLSLSISGMAVRDANYFLKHVGNYTHSTASLLRQALQLADTTVPELVLMMRQNGSKVTDYAVARYLQGSSAPRDARIIEIIASLTEIINTTTPTTPESIATLNAIMAQMLMTARLESFVNLNKPAQKEARLSAPLQEGVLKIKEIRARDAADQLLDHTADASTNAVREYEKDFNVQDFLQKIASYNTSSIVLLHKATEIAGITFHRLLTTMRSEGEKIGKHSINRILRGERIAADARYLQLQSGLQKIITAEMHSDAAAATIVALDKIFNEILTVALPLERYVRDNRHYEVAEILQAGFAKIATHKEQAVANHSHYLAVTRQATQARASHLRKVDIQAQLEEHQQRLARYQHSSRHYLQQALTIAGVQLLTQLRDKDAEIEISTGNVHVFKRDFNTEPLERFLQDAGIISSYQVRELHQRLQQEIAQLNISAPEKVTRYAQLEKTIAAALEALQVEAFVAHSDTTTLNLVGQNHRGRPSQEKEGLQEE